MTMGQVTWELPSGVRALRTFADMLFETAIACGARARIWGNRDEIGVVIDGAAYWLGIEFSKPEILRFATDKRKVNKEAAESLGVGTVDGASDGSAYWWKREVDLQSEEVHFFARPKPSQMQFLETFLRECLDLVKQIEMVEPDADPEEEPADTDEDSFHPPK